MKRWQFIVSLPSLFALIACGGASSAPVVGTTPQAQQQAPTHEPAAQPTTRIKAINFGGLIRGAQGLTDPTQHTDLGCVLGLEGEQAALGVAPVSAFKTIPEAPMHLSETLNATPKHARVLTRWGQRGADPYDLVLATVTPLPPTALAQPMVTLAITRTGIFVRETDQLVANGNALSREDATLWLLDRTSRGDVAAIVTAEAETPSTEVHALLQALPSSVQHVALAVALATDTRLPSTEPQAPDARTHCPDGLPDAPEGAAEGELPSASIVRSLSFIHEALQRCLSNTTGPGVGGGKVTLAIRIADTGNVSETCLVDDAIGDNVLAACITETARSATFSRPHPIGFVDVHAPLSLTPTFDAPPRPVCPARVTTDE